MTTVARTLLDVADLAPKRLGPALEAAERLGLFDLRAVEAALERARGHHGARALRAGLGAYRDPAFTRSGVERRFLRLCREAGLPAPAVNTWLAGHEVDMAWHDRRLAVELDTRDFHATRAAFERDPHPGRGPAAGRLPGPCGSRMHGCAPNQPGW